ncbi:hypothetical protein AKJ64_03650 [candidate division MSBL1 archaeon SCGC-AAA259E17]|uniref:DUF2080 family transposase-associated protein n=1 Tax=candidate division MSBL1 archaeon SCGC-AAA259E17 TaxID=1698263 RepID=A0A133UDH3_9EURY|nr:hypothetical protein AKJ64_03650 [candidate division MSBL1 archaeon SCGC-AAA259E17]
MTKGGVVISELSPAFRKAIERSIGVALEDPEKFVRVLKKAEIGGYEVVEKVAKKGGNSGRIYVPKEWIGKKVRAVLIENEGK